MNTEPSLLVAGGPTDAPINSQLRVEVAFSILGRASIPQHTAGVWVLDSIVDALADDAAALADGTAAPGPALTTERSTFIGALFVRSLEMSECITTGRIQTVRTQHGCIRFSYVLPGSRTSRRFRCQPDLAVAKAIDNAKKRDPGLTAAQKVAIRNSVVAALVPMFSTRRYGQPAYLQLRAGCPSEIRTGAEDGSEMGAFSHLKQPQREANLRLRLEEYLPFGLEPAIILAT